MEVSVGRIVNLQVTVKLCKKSDLKLDRKLELQMWMGEAHNMWWPVG